MAAAPSITYMAVNAAGQNASNVPAGAVGIPGAARFWCRVTRPNRPGLEVPAWHAFAYDAKPMVGGRQRGPPERLLRARRRGGRPGSANW